MRLINADALKKTLGDWIIAHYTDTFTGDDAGLQFAYLINRTETIDIGKGDKIMEWIPCTERLPEKSGRYLVTRKFNALSSLWARVGIVNYSDLMGLKKEKIWWTGNVGKSDFEKCDDVIAWMPLPKPYKKCIVCDKEEKKEEKDEDETLDDSTVSSSNPKLTKHEEQHDRLGMGNEWETTTDEEQHDRLAGKLYELSALNAKIGNLTYYMNSHCMVGIVGEELTEQLDAMCRYRDVLERRIVRGIY